MISVIIPTFNRENTIKRSIESVLDQTYKDIEVIIIDDCSMDKTEKIISEINDDRICYYKNKRNMGACASRNLGIEKARGEFIAFQDSDDVWIKKKLQKQYDFLKNQRCDIVYSSFLLFIDSKQKVCPSFVLNEKKNLYKQLLFQNCVSTQTIFGKKECFCDQKFDETMPRFQDWELALRLMQKYNMRFMKEILVNAYVQKNSISNNNEAGLKAVKKIYIKHENVIKEDNILNARYNHIIADCELQCGINPQKFYKKSFQLDFKLKIFLYYFLCKINLDRCLAYWKYKKM